MNHDEHDKLWELLGKAKEPKASPFFTSKVLRAVREVEEKPVGIFAWLRAKWFVPATVAAVACVSAVVMQFSPGGTPVDTSVKVAAVDPFAEIVKIVPEDDLDASLSSMFANQDHSVWLSADPSSLY